MKIGDKVKLYIFCYGSDKCIGEGIYLGTERVWRLLPHDAILEKQKKFKINNGIIYESNCTWRKA